MKQFMFILAALLSVATTAGAANYGNPVTIYPSGTPIPVSGSGSFTFVPSPSSVQQVSVIFQVTPTAPLPISFTSSPMAPLPVTGYARTVGWQVLTTTAYTGLTPNATVTLNVTTTAGSSAYKAYRVRVGVESGVTAIKWTGHNSATVPGTFGASNGFEVFPGDRWLPFDVFDFTGSNSPHFSVRAKALSGATSGTIWFDIAVQP